MLRRILIGAVGVLLVGDAVGLAALPSGEKRLLDVIPARAEMLLSESVGRARVLVIADGRALRLIVAYKQRGRWRSVHVDPPKKGSQAAYATTEGSGPVPAFSAVYGRLLADKATVRWHDGKAQQPKIQNGVYLAVRRGHIKADGVDLNPPAETTTTTPAP